MNDFASLDVSDLNFLALFLCFHRNMDSMYIIEIPLSPTRNEMGVNDNERKNITLWKQI